MKNLIQIVNKIRDSKLLKLDIDFLQSSVNLIFEKENNIFHLNLNEVSKIDVFEDVIDTQHISHLKFFENVKNQYLLCLDPNDEFLNQIQEKDNYIFKFNKFSLKNEIASP